MTEAFDFPGTFSPGTYNLSLMMTTLFTDKVGVNSVFRVLQLLKTIITIKKNQKDYEFNQKGSRIFVD
ncbi:hypothetical protein PL9631_660137 [Planktothrix paucivesiculata PCC 9631]|uniref:Uncharacterized protein n=1 Tax=Planktothrix paucivesiculata PCC 9631 TaxID=671071 RepID=A0A7Z9BZ19_9CYAN|nr:hypothetical protein PL9631_660137 [Planktothrix paucivesiculata PCC 9631]